MEEELRRDQRIQNRRRMVEIKNRSCKGFGLKLINTTFVLILLSIYVISLFLPSILVFDYEDATADHHQLTTTKSKGMDKEEGKPLMILDFLERLPQSTRIALVNMEHREWPPALGIAEEVKFDRISKNATWEQFFPIWIDESGERFPPSCPKMPMPEYGLSPETDPEVEVVVVSVPCRRKDGKLIGRDLDRLQVHLVAADVAVRIGKRRRRRGDGDRRLWMLVRSECHPMMELFRCKDMVRRDGMWWLYEVDVEWLAPKLGLPVGTCMLGASVKSQAGLNRKITTDHLRRHLDEEEDKNMKMKNKNKKMKMKMKKNTAGGAAEAYATVIHSSDDYLCGAITLAQSLAETGTTRDLILLHDDSIPESKLKALTSAGWSLRLITRIRNPHAKKGAYNLFNYTKLRLWQLTGYDKIVFIDADVVVLKNVDFLFGMPELSATADNTVLFNSGVMVIEPSNCTFGAMMDRLEEIVPYNGGDQGFLNEIFVWWHRLPRTVNFMKIFQNTERRAIGKKNQLFKSDPPAISTIHYFGMKPWQCYRDYDCNWNMKSLNVYANDAAHRRWWSIHDRMPDQLKGFCRLTSKRRATLDYFLKKAREGRYEDGHWKIQITDSRTLQ